MNKTQSQIDFLPRMCSRLFFALLFCVGLRATEMVLVIDDGSNLGFNESTAATPVGGNTGTTLGQQRRIALQYAADIWASALESSVPIEILTRFESLGCASTPILARGNPTSMISDFSNAPLASTLYPVALANALARVDLRPSIVPTDITLVFNADIESSCLGATKFYYGLDGQPGSDVDFVTVALRELAHGLGFYTPINGATGALSSGKVDIFIRNLLDETSNKRWNQMSDAERAASAVNTGKLVWAGDNLTHAAGSLSGGVNSSGKVQINAPNPYQSGLSLFHFSAEVAPTELLSPPSPTTVIHNPGLALHLLTDLGWTRQPQADLSLSVSVSNETPDLGDPVEVVLTLHNSGPDQAANTRVQVAMPAGLSYITHKGDGAFANATGIWELSQVSAAGNAVLRIQTSVVESGLLVFSAEIAEADQPDPDSEPGNGSIEEDDYTRVSLSSTQLLQSNQILGDIAVPAGEWRFFRVVADPGLAYLSFESYGGTGNADLYVRLSSLPTLEDYQKASRNPNNQDRVLFGPGGINPGDWFIGLYGQAGTRGLTLATQATANSLGVAILEVDPSSCPQITAKISVQDPSGPVSGLSVAKFSLKNNGAGVGSLSAFQELEAGLYQMNYTASAFGPAVLLEATVNSGGSTATAQRTFDGCNHGGPEVRVWLKPDELAYAGQQRVIPLMIQPISELIGVGSFEMRLFYDTNLLSFNQVEKSCTLIYNWDLVAFNEPNPGEIRISAANSNGFVISSFQDDVLLGLDFTINANANLGACAEISFDSDAFVFNNGSPTPGLSDGQLCITTAPANALTSDLELFLSVSNSEPNVGEAIYLTYILSNSGPLPIDSASVHVPLPSGLHFIEVISGGGFSNQTETWSVSCLRENSYRAVTIKASVTSDQDQTIEAEVNQASESDSDSTPNNQDPTEDDQISATIYPLSADLELSMSTEFTELYKESQGTFTIHVTNNGPDFVPFYEVFDELPAGLTLVETSGPGTYDPETSKWAVSESLAVGETDELVFHVALASKGTKTNIAYLNRSSRYDPDSTPGNEVVSEDDYDSASLTPLTTDLRLAQIIDNATPKVGANISVTLTVSNDGPLAESNLVISEKLPKIVPPGLSFVSASGSGFNASTGEWLAGDLSVGQSKSITLTFSVDNIPAKILTGEISQTRHFDSDSAPGNGAAGEDDLAAVSLTPQYADLSLVATATTGTEVSLQQAVAIEMSAANAGANTAASCSVDAPIPAGFSFESFSGEGSYNSKTGLWTIGTLASGAGATGTLNLRVQTISNLGFFAEIASSDQADPDSIPGNRIATEDDIVRIGFGVPVADLRLSMTVDDSSPDPGQTIQYQLRLYNDGPSAANAVSVRDQLPVGLTFQGFSGPGSYDSGTGIWTLGEALAKGASKIGLIDARVEKDLIIVNSAEVASSLAYDPDSTPGNGVTTEDDYAFVKTGRADLELAMAVDQTEPPVGGTVVFTIGVVNRGPGATSGVTVRDKLPVGLNFVSSSGAGSYDSATSLWTIGNLALNQTATLSIVARVFGGAQKTNTAEIASSDLGDPDSTPGNGQVGEDDLASVSLVGQCGNGDGNILVVNKDGAGEGFNDGRVVAAVGGNSGRTVGQQRLIAFQYAAEIWTQILTPSVDIAINANFDPLQCSSSGGILGMAGPNAVARDFEGAAFPQTFYHMAIANNIVGYDQNGSVAEITALFNSSIDSNNSCLSQVNWYYGLDGNPPGNDIDFVTVLLHELGHGLGFSSLADGNSGQKFMGYDDIFMQFLEDHSTGKLWPQMSNAERAASARDTGDLHWTGPSVTAALGTLSAGTSGGHARMYAPSSFQSGSSVSHWDKVMAPNQLMEPSYTQILHDPDLATKLLEDVGWTCQTQPTPKADLSLAMSASNAIPAPDEDIDFQVTILNSGPAPATGVSVRIPFPNGITYASQSGTGTFDEIDGVWTLGSLAVNQQASLTLTGSVSGTESFNLLAEVLEADQADPDSTPNNGLAEEDDFAFVSIQPEIPLTADLSLSMFLDRQIPNEGDRVSLYLSVHNSGPDPVQAVTAKFPTNAGLSYEADNAGGNYDSSSKVWNLGSLHVGESKSMRLDVIVNTSANLMLLGQVWSSELADPDSTPGNGQHGEDDEYLIEITPQSGVCPPSARIEIVNLDSAHEGFNDETPVRPVGGNPGVTLGEQRWLSFLRAADELAGYLSSGQIIKVGAKFDSMACTATGAVLGTAGPAAAVRDFDGAPFSATWYPVALANALSNADLNDDTPEIVAVFNKDIDLNDVHGKRKKAKASQLAKQNDKGSDHGGGGDDEDEDEEDDEDDGSCRCGLPANPDECESVETSYLVERKNVNYIKFINTATGLGDGYIHESDRFIIQASGNTRSIKVKVKSVSNGVITLTGVGDSKVTKNGFCVKFESVSEDGFYTIALTSTCNRYPLEYVDFKFNGGHILYPATSFTSVRTRLCGGDEGDGDGEGDEGEGDCLIGLQWYYGFDANPGNNLDLLTVVKHELLHGLGFTTFVDLAGSDATAAGSKLDGYDDAYMRFLEDESTGTRWTDMTNKEREDSSFDTDDLVWVGPYVTQALGATQGGTSPNGMAQLFAPNPYAEGLSVTHWTPNFSPNQLMEPSYYGAIHDPGLAIPLLYDIGWASPACTDLSLEMTVDNATPDAGDSITFTLSVTNHGPENGTGIQVSDPLPSGFEYLSDNGGGSYDAGTGIWQLGDLSAGSRADLEIQVRVLLGGEKTNVAEISAADQRDPDSQPSNGASFEDDWESVGTGNADLSLTLAVDRTPVLISEVVQFTLTLHNDGPDRPNSAQVNFDLPEGLIYLSDDGQGAFLPLVGEWHLAGIDNGETLVLQINARAAVVDNYSLSAEIIQSSLRDSDSTPGNHSSSEDDDDSASLVVSYPAHELVISAEAVFPAACPVMSVRAIVTQDGQPLSGLEVSNFSLREDGILVSFSLAEDLDFPGTYLLSYSSARPDGGLHQADVSVSFQGNSAFSGTPFTICDSNGCTTLVNHLEVPYVSGFRGTLRCFRFSVPPLQRLLKFRIYDGEGDADLLIRRGAEPSYTSWDYRPNIPGNSETVSINYPQSGDWYADIHGFREYSNVSIIADYYPSLYDFEIIGVYPSACPQIQAKVQMQRDGAGVQGLTAANFSVKEDGVAVSFTLQALAGAGQYSISYGTIHPDGLSHKVEISCNVFGEVFSESGGYQNCAIGCSELSNNKVVANIGGLQGFFRCFYIEVPEGMDGLEFKAWDGVGDSDMYVRFGQEPSLEGYDYRPLEGGNSESQRIENPAAGRWYMSLYAFQDFNNLKIKASYYRFDLSLEITDDSLADCPLVSFDTSVTFAGQGQAGLLAEDFLIQENGEIVTPASFTDLGGGNYRIGYLTNSLTLDPVSVSCSVTTANRSASDDFVFAYCNARGPFVYMWINQGHAAPPDSDVVIPVWVGPVRSDFGVNSIEIRMTYDARVLEYRGLSTTGTLLSAWPSVLDSESVQGDLRIAAASLDERRVLSAAAEENKLVNLRFRVRADAVEENCVLLNLVESDIIFNDGLPYALIQDGLFCPLQCPSAKGDVDGDGNNREAFDARMILQSVLKKPTPYDPIPLCVADTNCSGTVSLTDVVKVLQYGVRYIDGYCLNGPGTRSGTGFSISIPGESLTPEAGQAFQIGIDVSSLDPFYGYGFRLEYDPAKLSLSGLTDDIGTMSERYEAPTVESETGAVSVYGFYPTVPLVGEGRLINLEAFALQPGLTQISFTLFELADESESQNSFGPFALTIGGENCYSQQAYESLIIGWPNGTSVLSLIQLLNCQ